MRTEDTMSQDQLTDGYSTNESTSRDGSMDDGDVIDEFLFKDAVEVFAASDRHQSIGIRQVSKYSNLITIFELRTCSHLKSVLIKRSAREDFNGRRDHRYQIIPV